MKRDVVIAVLLIIAGIILAGCPVRRGGFLEGRELTEGVKPAGCRASYSIVSD